MKKILSVLLLIVLAIPMVVKADLTYVNAYFSKSDVAVGEEIIVFIPLVPDATLNTEIIYDSSMLKTSRDMVEIVGKDEGGKFNGEEGCEIVRGIKEATVEDGKVRIMTRIPSYNCDLENYPVPAAIIIKFTAIKEGTAHIDFDEQFVSGDADIKITKGNADSSGSCPICEQKDCDCPVVEKCEEKECNCPVVTEKENDNNCNLWLYCSLGLNALLLIVLIIVAATRKKKPVVIEQPKEVIEETKEENKEE